MSDRASLSRGARKRARLPDLHDVGLLSGRAEREGTEALREVAP